MYFLSCLLGSVVVQRNVKNTLALGSQFSVEEIKVKWGNLSIWKRQRRLCGGELAENGSGSSKCQ